MSHQFSDDDGIFLVKLARETLDRHIETKTKTEVPGETPTHLKKNSGAFVTLNTLQRGETSLRGCIGRPYPTQPLVEAVIESAIDASTNDPRFPPVRPSEIDSIVVELSILTPPQKLEYENPNELLDLIKVGRDGLIVVRGILRGLLLPQVPVDWKWDIKEFLEHTCNKAGLPKEAWTDSATEFYSFQAEIFGETSPRGDIVRNPKHQRCR